MGALHLSTVAAEAKPRQLFAHQRWVMVSLLPSSLSILLFLYCFAESVNTEVINCLADLVLSLHGICLHQNAPAQMTRECQSYVIKEL